MNLKELERMYYNNTFSDEIKEFIAARKKFEKNDSDIIIAIANKFY